MSPATPTRKVSKTKTTPKKAPNDQFNQDQKLYFLWLHLQLKQGKKINHTAVAEKLNINYKTAFGRFGQMKKHMEKFEESLAASAEPASTEVASTEAASAEENELDFEKDALKKAFDDLDKIFSEGESLR